MAKKNSTRRRARKPKLIDVKGHQLTDAMYADLNDRVGFRAAQTKDAHRALALGLDDFLSKYRPSRKAESLLLDISKGTTSVALAIGAMSNYGFYVSNPLSIRSAGCEVLKRLAQELHHASTKLTAFANSVEAEESTKLQDWIVRDEQVARIGQGAKVAAHA